MSKEKEYSHITISSQSPSDKRKSKPPAFEIKHENKEILYQKISNDIKNLQKSFRSETSKYYTPNFIFQISFNQPVSDKAVKRNLQKSNLKLITASPKFDGPWIVSTEDNLQSLEGNLEKYRKASRKSDKISYEFLDTFTEAKEIPIEFRVGKLLQKKPLTKIFEEIDIEVLPMENYKIIKFLNELRNFLIERGGELLDDHTVTTHDFCSTRILINKNIFDELIRRREIKSINRPPKYVLEGLGKSEYSQGAKEIRPPANSPEILVIDSGINDHPIIKNSIKVNANYVDDNDSNNDEDCPHGLAVSSIALYRDLEDKIPDNSFDPMIWINSAKILTKDDEGQYVTSKNIVPIIRQIVEEIIKKNPKCKVINYSIGDPEEKQNEYSMQSILASEIDRISREYDIIFVISAGNNFNDVSGTETYPKFLLEETERVKILDPGYSALAITVGSIQRDEENIKNNDVPSHFTRIGPGFGGMIKPELVDYGGKYTHDGIVVANSRWRNELYCQRRGTSFSTPRISHQLALLTGKFPYYSANLIKALLLSSAKLPQNKPMLVEQQPINKIMNIYGYGKTDLNEALFSTDNRVLLIHEGNIGINKIVCFPILIPKEFNQVGRKVLSVTLVYNPPVSINNSNYLLIGMDFLIVKDSIDNIFKKYGSNPNSNINTPSQRKKVNDKTVKLIPSNKIRKKGVHQKGIKIFTGRTKIPSDNFYLVVRSADKGIEDLKHKQSFSIVIRIEHESELELYSKLNENHIKIQDENRIRLDLRSS